MEYGITVCRSVTLSGELWRPKDKVTQDWNWRLIEESTGGSLVKYTHCKVLGGWVQKALSLHPICITHYVVTHIHKITSVYKA